MKLQNESFCYINHSKISPFYLVIIFCSCVSSTLVYRTITCPANYSLISINDQAKVLWIPSRFHCSFSLQNNKPIQISVSVRWGLLSDTSSDILPPIPCFDSYRLTTDTSLRKLCTRRRLKQGVCLTLLFTTNGSNELRNWRTWNWNKRDPQLLSISENLEFTFCGNQNISVRILAPYAPLPSIMPQTEPILSEDVSWTTGEILMRIVIPALAVFMVIIILAICVFCLLRRTLFCDQRRSRATTSSCPAHTGFSEHHNPAFIEDPPNYNEISKYPLSENYQNQLKDTENKRFEMGGPSNAKNFGTVRKFPLDEKVSDSPRSASPPPLYAHTRRRVDEEGMSLYEVIMDPQSMDKSSMNHTISDDNHHSQEHMASAPSLDSSDQHIHL